MIETIILFAALSLAVAAVITVVWRAIRAEWGNWG